MRYRYRLAVHSLKRATELDWQGVRADLDGKKPNTMLQDVVSTALTLLGVPLDRLVLCDQVFLDSESNSESTKVYNCKVVGWLTQPQLYSSECSG